MFEFLNIAALLCSFGYSSCEEPTTPVTPPPVVYPSEGTVIEAYCDGTTFVEIVADGKGNNNEFREEQSEQCGYVPPVNPPYGTLLREGCSKEYPGIKWFLYADGEGGTYSEKDRRSRECGYYRTMTLTTETEVGDRFHPVVIDVEYVNNRGELEGWGMVHSNTTLGYAERVAFDKVHIYGDGRTGTGIFTLGAEEIQYSIDREPICTVENRIDCQGYYQRTGDSMIYYGEEDNHIVTWELAVLIYASHANYGDDLEIGFIEEYSPLDSVWEKWEKRIQQYNEIYARSGVYVEIVLKELHLAHYHTLGDLQGFRPDLPVDIILGHGMSYPDTCGVARVTTYFREGKPPVSLSRCGIDTDLHEIGHTVGLAHGPENQSNQDIGYIFPDFGHGWNDICGSNDDLMSYGYQGNFHTNETLYCSDIFTQDTNQVAGSRQYTDTAYSLNRVRYNVSLINDDNKYVEEEEPAKLQRIISRSDYKELEVID